MVLGELKDEIMKQDAVIPTVLCTLVTATRRTVAINRVLDTFGAMIIVRYTLRDE